jgi:multisubunit Na+/H+ antiporter MnhG subunit
MKTNKIKRTLNRLHKRIYRTNKDHNLSTLYILITVIALIYVFPIIVNTVVTLTMLVVITIIDPRNKTTC